MDYEEVIKQFDSQEILDKLYGFAYKRCNDSHKAEDLCSEIIVKVLLSARRNAQIEHIHAYVWAIAHKVYADLCEKRRIDGERLTTDEFSENAMNVQTNPIDEFLESEEDKRRLQSVLRNIAFLSKIYRDVMVMYYIDGLKTAEIAKKLSISETVVKQRLFSARNQIKEEADTMQAGATLKPIDIAFIGTGNPVGNDPRGKAERVLSKNLVYLCRNQAFTAKEISEKLNVPLPYVEDEIEIQLRGENGNYGLLRQVGKDKYIANILILDIPELEVATKTYTKYLKEFCNGLNEMLDADSEKIMNFPFLSKQSDLRFVLWTLISKAVWKLDGAVCDLLKQKYFADIELIKRDFSTLGFAIKDGEKLDVRFYGCDGFKDVIQEYDVYGYSSIFVSNVYGERLDKHFSCGHHVLTDSLLLITVRAIGGLSVNTLTENEKETAAKAIECGYLRKDGNMLYPKIVVFSEEKERDFYGLLSGFDKTINVLAEKIAAELSGLIKRYVPKHLINEYTMFSMGASIRILNDVIEACIAEDLLTVPNSRLCGEGVMMIVK